MRRLTASVLAAFWFVAPCFAWGAEGHRIVGAIAAASLDDATARAVRDLLGEQTLADACCWADEIRSNTAYDWVKPLHYINLPRGATAVDMTRDGANGEQVITAIAKYRDVLKDQSRSRAERVEALKLLCHFVGDVHQPFHVSYKDDKGGNMLTVKSFGEKSNMHRVFDSDLIKRRLKDTKGGWPVMAADLRQAISAEERAEWLKSADPLVWANESFALTLKAYAEPPKGPNDVDDSYYATWMPVVNKRLEAAGVRLGAMLNETLKDAGAAKGGGAAKPPAARSRKDGKKSTGKDGGAGPAQGVGTIRLDWKLQPFVESTWLVRSDATQ